MGDTPAVVLKGPTPTAKTVINQKYGKTAIYKTEVVPESVQNDIPGLSITLQGPCLYRCTLELPEFSVTSEPFKRKKEAEQAAASMALEKLGTETTSIPTAQEAHDEMISRICYLFSDEVKFLSSPHPLAGHFQQSLRGKDDRHGLIPLPILAALDSKLKNLCKCINPKAESDVLLTVELIKGAARSCSSVKTSEEKNWIWKQTPYTQEARQALLDRNSGCDETISVEALYIPFSIERSIKPVVLNVLSDGYYMDAIAQELGVMDASQVLLSRSFGKASSEMRIYFLPPRFPCHPTSNVSNSKEMMDPDMTLNARACYFSGLDIHGDAILAAIGFTWRSSELFHENLSLGAYYRMLVGKLPDGGCKISRDAILAAELPSHFSSRSNWRGSLPRDLLCTFCRVNWLAEPEFSTVNIDDSHQYSETCKKLKLANTSEEVYENGRGIGNVNAVGAVSEGGSFSCAVKVLSKNRDMIIECLPQGSFKKQNDAVQSASLKVLSWLNKYFKQPNVTLEKWSSSSDTDGIHVRPDNVRKEFALALSVHKVCQNSGLQSCASLGSDWKIESHKQIEFDPPNIEGPNSGVYPSNGYLACISYSISLKRQREQKEELLESCEEFEFEIGAGTVGSRLEACVTQMSVGQSACFSSELPSEHLILAAAHENAESLSTVCLKDCSLEYSLNLVRVTEPLEDRMEQALFSPPLSKQRVEFALTHINESRAITLVDFGCGSGSLLESLMNYPTSLEKIAGVDISRKGLTRAAKVLHSKLTTNSEALTLNRSIRSAVLYDGSIIVFDQRLYGFDIGTCLEVIEHMEEDQARLFGDIVLGSFRPRILIVSTPNYEYNSILQGSTPSTEGEREDDKSESLSCKFRNHDHKFEWTRNQFNYWASDLASRYNYSVEFSGVGGSGDLEPGFASQIAVFRNCEVPQADKALRTQDMTSCYEVIWEWASDNKT